MFKMNKFLWIFVAQLLVWNGCLTLDMHFAFLISVFALWVIVEESNYGIYWTYTLKHQIHRSIFSVSDLTEIINKLDIPVRH